LLNVQDKYYDNIIIDEANNLTIYWCADCNVACEYCYIKKDKKCLVQANKEIQAALKDGSYIKVIKTYLEKAKNKISYIDFWGAEPTLNAEYFKDFTIELLDFFPNVTQIMLSTNAKVGGKIIYDYMVEPIREYCQNNKRRLTFSIQCSLDGPAEINDKSRYPGATDRVLDTLKYLCSTYPKESQYMYLQLFTKATVTDEHYAMLLEGDNLQQYYQFLDDIYVTMMDAKGENTNLDFYPGSPTIVDPGEHTVENGKTFAQWIRKLFTIDRTNFKYYDKHPLFLQPIRLMDKVFQSKNLLADGWRFLTCNSGKDGLVINHRGDIFSCHILGLLSFLNDNPEIIKEFGTTLNVKNAKELLGRRLASNQFHESLTARVHFFDIVLTALVHAGQVDDIYLRDWDQKMLLFYFITNIWCPAGSALNHTMNYFVMPTSYFKLFGNGATQAIVEYYQYEVKQGAYRPWETLHQ
jgi:sulfatase maturation enzyme AslB (radical SAM superfamily)